MERLKFSETLVATLFFKLIYENNRDENPKKSKRKKFF